MSLHRRVSSWERCSRVRTICLGERRHHTPQVHAAHAATGPGAEWAERRALHPARALASPAGHRALRKLTGRLRLGAEPGCPGASSSPLPWRRPPLPARARRSGRRGGARHVADRRGERRRRGQAGPARARSHGRGARPVRRRASGADRLVRGAALALGRGEGPAGRHVQQPSRSAGRRRHVRHRHPVRRPQHPDGPAVVRAAAGPGLPQAGRARDADGALHPGTRARTSSRT